MFTHQFGKPNAPAFPITLPCSAVFGFSYTVSGASRMGSAQCTSRFQDEAPIPRQLESVVDMGQLCGAIPAAVRVSKRVHCSWLRSELGQELPFAPTRNQVCNAPLN
jgi:hypothetical protein